MRPRRKFLTRDELILQKLVNEAKAEMIARAKLLKDNPAMVGKDSGLTITCKVETMRDGGLFFNTGREELKVELPKKVLESLSPAEQKLAELLVHMTLRAVNRICSDAAERQMWVFEPLNKISGRALDLIYKDNPERDSQEEKVSSESVG